ncbi:nitrogen fixation protein NifQ [Azospirillum oleiclasticum]|nr:nitrogen fixation protein NifQ [Azospirillum oleiclasticum]
MTDTTMPPEAFTIAPQPLDGLDGDALDGYLAGLILAQAAREDRPLTEALGLPPGPLAGLVHQLRPDAVQLLDGAVGDTGEDAIEEADLRAFLLEHRAGRGAVEEWLAAIVARRSLAPNHLWQDMGFTNRRELNAFFRRHFPALVALNSGDMKWKKFFYRQLCLRVGMLICKSPNCEVCDDFAACFEAEEGDPLSTLAQMGRGA